MKCLDTCSRAGSLMLHIGHLGPMKTLKNLRIYFYVKQLHNLKNLIHLVDTFLGLDNTLALLAATNCSFCRNSSNLQ